MNPLLKNVALAAVFSLMAACSPSTASKVTQPSQSPVASASPVVDKQMIDHSNMGDMGGMDMGPADADYDLRFIDGMRIHHRGAIAMAKEAEQKSKRQVLKSFARNIVIAQNREENDLLRKWRQAWYPNAPESPVAYDAQMGHMMPMSAEQKSSMSMKMDLGAADAGFDLRFMNAMIPHHEGALAMAKDALTKSKRPEIKQLAQMIIASQQTEINQMQQWRKAWYKS